MSDTPAPPPPPPSGGFPQPPGGEGGFPQPPSGGSPPPPGGFGTPGWTPASLPRRSGLALAAMIVGIVGLFLFFVVIPSIVALVLGLVSASQIKSSRGQQTGLGLARAGWILGIVGILGFGGLITAVVLTDDETAVFDLEPGDCVNGDELGSAGEATFTELPVVDCDEPHDGEVVGIPELNPDRDREYPSEIELSQEAFNACQEEFEEYAGTSLDSSDFDLVPIITNEQAWRSERGKAICIAIGFDGEELNEPIGN